MKYTFQHHIDSGKHEKRVWWWPCKWYVYPWALEWDEWEKEDAFMKANYPVQFFFRETVPIFFGRIHYKLKDIKYDIKGKIRNPRKEMREKVFPYRWSDLTHSIVVFHMEALIEFVDREKCFESTDYTWSEDHKEFAKGLKECYHYAKSGRKELEDKLDQAYKRVPDDGEYNVIYKEVHEIEAQIEEYDTKVCEWVIKNRCHFWC